jgi:hypothetical protein
MTKHLRAPAHMLATDIVLGGFPLPKTGNSKIEVVNFMNIFSSQSCMLDMGGIECF